MSSLSPLMINQGPFTFFLFFSLALMGKVIFYELGLILNSVSHQRQCGK